MRNQQETSVSEMLNAIDDHFYSISNQIRWLVLAIQLPLSYWKFPFNNQKKFIGLQYRFISKTGVETGVC